MPWQKKASAPDYVNGLARIRLGMVDGSIDDWWFPWINLIQLGESMDVNAFCSAGPPPPADFQSSDFLGFGSLPGAVLSIIGLQGKITARAREVLFGQLCEYSQGVSGCVTLYEGTTAFNNNRQFEEYDTIAHISLPTGATSIRIWETLLPNNAQNAAWPGNWKSLRVTFRTTDFVTTYQDLHPVNLSQFQTYVDLTIPNSAPLVSIGISDNPPGDYGLRVDGCGPGLGTEEYTPVPAEQPAAAIAPTPGVYTTIADLGTELDAIEQKIHWVLNYVEPMALDRFVPLVADDISGEITNDEDLELGPEVVGVVVTVSGLGAGVDMRFGAPPQLHNVGRVTLGNGTAWLPPVDITVSPMLLLRPDPTVTACRVHVLPPASATITTLVRATPAG